MGDKLLRGEESHRITHHRVLSLLHDASIRNQLNWANAVRQVA